MIISHASQQRPHRHAPKLAEQFAKGNELEKTIHEKLKGIGYGF